MKQTLTILLFILGSCLLSQRIYSQQYKITGTDICSDGTQSTHISLSDSDPDKLYALYRDDQFLVVKGCKTGKVTNVINYGDYSETGQYHVVEFTKANCNTDHPEKGKRLSGSVNIYSIPVGYIPKELQIKSGTAPGYKPKSNIEGCIFKWTAHVDKGKATGFQKAGEGAIKDTIRLQGSDPADVIYTIVPYSPANLGGCMGKSYEIIVRITP